MVQITIRGKKYEVEREEIIEAIKDREPKLIKTHYVEIEGVKYPIKQPVALALKIPAIAFTSVDAYRLLDRLGFEIQSIEE